MTDLTEQWKKGELEAGWYYVYLKHLEMFDIAGSSTLFGILERGNEDSTEVLAPVPSYQEYLESESHCAVYSEVNKSLKEENQKLSDICHELEKENACLAVDLFNLKELLEEAKDIIEWYKADCCYKDTPTEAILTKIDNAIGEK